MASRWACPCSGRCGSGASILHRLLRALAGDVERYLFVDTLDVARKLGRFESGASAGAFVRAAPAPAWPARFLVRNDRLGAWRASARAGSTFEVRLVRSFAF